MNPCTQQMNVSNQKIATKKYQDIAIILPKKKKGIKANCTASCLQNSRTENCLTPGNLHQAEYMHKIKQQNYKHPKSWYATSEGAEGALPANIYLGVDSCQTNLSCLQWQFSILQAPDFRDTPDHHHKRSRSSHTCWASKILNSKFHHSEFLII